jgi:hypothetical protein
MQSARFLKRLPASFPNLQSLTLQACKMEDQTLTETAQLEKIAAGYSGLKIQVREYYVD